MTFDSDWIRDLARPTIELSEAFAWVEVELRLALALQADQPLRERVLGGRPRLLVTLPMESGWLALTSEGLVQSRSRPEGFEDAPERAFSELLHDPAITEHPSNSEVLEAAYDTSRARVISLMADDRQGFKVLEDWAPILEGSIYRVSAILLQGLDGMRPRARAAIGSDKPEADLLAINYRKVVKMLGRTTLLATDGEAPWLGELAKSFTWMKWTPSFPLTRERDHWSTAVGARAASRFGPSVIDRYLEAYGRADHPMLALDALVGMSAIGWRHPGERSNLVQALDEIGRSLSTRDVPRADIVAAGIMDARRLLTDGAPKPAQIFSHREDAFTLDAEGRLPIFSLIPAAVEMAAWRFIPPKGGNAPPGHVAREVFVRAWGARLDLDQLPSDAFGRPQ